MAKLASLEDNCKLVIIENDRLTQSTWTVLAWGDLNFIFYYYYCSLSQI